MAVYRFVCGIVAICLAGTAMADTAEARFSQAFADLSMPASMAMTAGFLQGNQPAIIHTTGPRFKGSEQSVPENARWHVGSITKSFTATLLARMTERGVIDFTTPLGTLLPELAPEMHPDWQSLTLTEILSHTAGLRPNFTDAEMEEPGGPDHMLARLIRLRAHWAKPLPGTRGSFAYSNMGYVLAGLIAETRTGLPWQDLILREIAGPLNLTSIGFGAPSGAADPWGHTARFLRQTPVEPTDLWSDNPAWLGPAGTLHMSLADLLTWGQTHMRACRGEMPDFLSAETCTLLHTPVSSGYALGWVVDDLAWLGGGIIHTHNGSNTMWFAQLAYAPERDLVLAVVINQARGLKASRAMLVLGNALVAPD